MLTAFAQVLLVGLGFASGFKIIELTTNWFKSQSRERMVTSVIRELYRNKEWTRLWKYLVHTLTVEELIKNRRIMEDIAKKAGIKPTEVLDGNNSIC